jgi:hypothetical protein
METKLVNLSGKFNKLNEKINNLIGDTHLKSDILIAKIENKINFNELIDEINIARDCLLKSLIEHQKLLLKKLNYSDFIINGENVETFSIQVQKLFYTENSVIKTMDNSYVVKLIDHIFKRNNLFLKFKYFNLFYNGIQKVNLYYGMSEKMVLKKNKIVLSKQRTFYFTEFSDKTCYMLIRDDLSNRDLVKSSIIYLRYFENYQFLATDTHIIGLFYDDYCFVLKLYTVKNENFTLISSKTFKFKIILHSINKHEIICLTNQINANRYLALSYDLDIIDRFGQKIDEDKPFYFGDGSLINCSINKIFVYFYDHREQKHSIKIMNRSSGKTEKNCLIDLPLGTKFKQIKIDSSFRILIFSEMSLSMKNTEEKEEIDCTGYCKKIRNSILYFDTDGKFLFRIKSNLFMDLKSFDLTSEDDLYFIDYEKKINFF